MYRKLDLALLTLRMNVEKDIFKMLLSWNVAKDTFFPASHFAIPSPFFYFVSFFLHQMFPRHGLQSSHRTGHLFYVYGTLCTFARVYRSPDHVECILTNKNETHVEKKKKRFYVITVHSIVVHFYFWYPFWLAGRDVQPWERRVETWVYICVHTVALCWTCVSQIKPGVCIYCCLFTGEHKALFNSLCTLLWGHCSLDEERTWMSTFNQRTSFL